jgi:hypothetical protein
MRRPARWSTSRGSVHGARRLVNVIDKIRSDGQRMIIPDRARGCFGYNNRGGGHAHPAVHAANWAAGVFDATHSCSGRAVRADERGHGRWAPPWRAAWRRGRRWCMETHVNPLKPSRTGERRGLKVSETVWANDGGDSWFGARTEAKIRRAALAAVAVCVAQRRPRRRPEVARWFNRHGDDAWQPLARAGGARRP